MTKRLTAIDFVFEAFYSGAIGGSIVALSFLVADAMNGQLLFTPSLLGSILFRGMPADAVVGVHLDMVAYYSLLHFGMFGLVGAAATLLVHSGAVSSRHPVQVFFALFLCLEAGSAIFGAVLGVLPVAVANLFAATGMAVFFAWSRRQMRDTTPDAALRSGDFVTAQ